MGKIDPKIVDKIRKLLSLGANNPESNEASAALRKAAELAEMHGLALSDVDRETGETIVEQMMISMIDQKYHVWMNPLASYIATIFNCEIVIRTIRYGEEKGKYTIFVGTPTDIKLAVWYYKLIRLQVIRNSKAKFKLVKDQKTYGLGAVTVLNERLTTMFVKVQEEVRTSDVRALVVVKNQEVQKAFHEMFPKLKKATRTNFNMGSMEAYTTGMADGKKMGLHSGEISGKKQTYIGE